MARTWETRPNPCHRRVGSLSGIWLGRADELILFVDSHEQGQVNPMSINDVYLDDKRVAHIQMPAVAAICLLDIVNLRLKRDRKDRSSVSTNHKEPKVLYLLNVWKLNSTKKLSLFIV